MNDVLDLNEDRHLDENTCDEIKKYLKDILETDYISIAKKNSKENYVLGFNKYELDTGWNPCYLEINLKDIEIFDEEGNDYPADSVFTAKDIEKYLLELFELTRDEVFFIDRKTNKYFYDEFEIHKVLTRLSPSSNKQYVIEV
jgi:hypothetical protein